MKNLSILCVLREICFAVISVWIFSPYQSFIANWSIYGGVWLLWLALAFLSNFKVAQQVLLGKMALIAFSWHLCIAILSLFDWADFSIKQFTIPFLIIASIYYIKGGYYKSLVFLIVIYILYLLLIEFYTIPVLIETPEAARLLANSDKTVTEEIAGPFMANFETVNSIAIFSLALIVVLKTSHKQKLVYVLTIVFLAISVLCLYYAQYTIPLLLFTFVSLFIIFSRANKKTTSTIVLYSLLGLGLFILLGPLFGWIADMLNGDGVYATRFRSLSVFFSSGQIDQNKDIGIRASLYRDSIRVFFDNMLYGVGGKVYKAGGLVGGHSDILDNFAYYGIFFGSLFVWFLINSAKLFKNVFSSKFWYYYRFIFIVFFVDCLFNTCYKDSLLYVTFFVVPSLLALLQYQDTEITEYNH